MIRLGQNPAPILTLISCHTGAGEDGADLLFALAQVINYPVRARTGFTYCGGGVITYEAGSTWQTATPSVRPNAIAAPTPHLEVLPMKLLLMDSTGKPNEIDSDMIESVEFYAPTKAVSGQALMVQAEPILIGQAAKDLLELVDFSRPFRLGGAPAAIVTGVLRLTFKQSRANELPSRDFTIYNHRAVQDMSNPETFYRVSPSIRSGLERLTVK